MTSAFSVAEEIDKMLTFEEFRSSGSHGQMGECGIVGL